MRNPLLFAALICLLGGNATWAQTRQAFEHWELQSASGYLTVAATKSGRNEAGVFCLVDEADCKAYVAIAEMKCDEKSQYPALLNSSAGANAVMLTCRTVAGEQLLVINEFELAMTAFETSGEFGIAFPLRSGRYEVARYSAKGAIAAIDSARRNRESRRTQNPTSERL